MRPHEVKPARVVTAREFASAAAWAEHVDRLEAALCGHITWDDFPVGDGAENEKKRWDWNRAPYIECTFVGHHHSGALRRYKWRLRPSAPAEIRRQLACRAAQIGIAVVEVIGSILVKDAQRQEREAV